MWVCFCAPHSVPLIYLSTLCQRQTVLINVEIRSYTTVYSILQYIVCSSKLFGCSIPLRFHVKVRITLSISIQNSSRILIGITLNLYIDQVGENQHLLGVWTHSISLHLFRSAWISLCNLVIISVLINILLDLSPNI